MGKRIGDTPKFVLVLILLAAALSACAGFVMQSRAKANAVQVMKNFSTMPCKDVLSSLDTSQASFVRFQQCAK
jgi:hypothetical protein